MYGYNVTIVLHGMMGLTYDIKIMVGAAILCLNAQEE